MSHTVGKLMHDGFGAIGAQNDQLNGGFFVSECCGPDKFDNSLRIVASWNVCEGSPTEALVEMQQKGLTLGQLAFLYAKAKTQRDELQVALRKYGLHKLTCAYVENHEGGIFGKSTAACDCGFADVIDSAKGGE